MLALGLVDRPGRRKQSPESLEIAGDEIAEWRLAFCSAGSSDLRSNGRRASAARLLICEASMSPRCRCQPGDFNAFAISPGKWPIRSSSRRCGSRASRLSSAQSFVARFISRPHRPGRAALCVLAAVSSFLLTGSIVVCRVGSGVLTARSLRANCTPSQRLRLSKTSRRASHRAAYASQRLRRL